MLWVKSLHIVFIASWFAGLFRPGRPWHGHVGYRSFNEAPMLLILAIVALAAVKPF